MKKQTKIQKKTSEKHEEIDFNFPVESEHRAWNMYINDDEEQFLNEVIPEHPMDDWDNTDWAQLEASFFAHRNIRYKG